MHSKYKYKQTQTQETTIINIKNNNNSNNNNFAKNERLEPLNETLGPTKNSETPPTPHLPESNQKCWCQEGGSGLAAEGWIAVQIY
jgi:hypothetical protein